MCAVWPHPDSVSLSQSYWVGQFDLDLSTVEGAKHTHHLQQTVIQSATQTAIIACYHGNRGQVSQKANRRD